MKFLCLACLKEIKKPGALLFGPPKNNKTYKAHICDPCYKKIFTDIADFRYLPCNWSKQKNGLLTQYSYKGDKIRR